MLRRQGKFFLPTLSFTPIDIATLQLRLPAKFYFEQNSRFCPRKTDPRAKIIEFLSRCALFAGKNRFMQQRRSRMFALKIYLFSVGFSDKK